MILPVPFQAFFAACFTVWTWRIATLPVSTSSDHREREEQKQTKWRIMTHRMAKLNIDWCIGYKVKSFNLVWFLWFVKAIRLRIAHSTNFVFPPPIITDKTAILSQGRGKFKQALGREQVEQNKRMITQFKDTNIYWIVNFVDYKIFAAPSYTGGALGYRGKSGQAEL